MMSVLARNWWAFVVRGVLAILFGLIALFVPAVTMLSLVIVFAAYAATDGVFAIVSAVRAANQGERWGWLALEGVAGIVAGIAAILWPGLTVALFIALIAVWAIITGGLLLTASFRVDANDGRWWLALGAVASLVYGMLLLVAPMIGALVLTWWIGAYAIVFGISMIAAALRLRARLRTASLSTS